MREFYVIHKERIDRLLFLAIVIVGFYLLFAVFFVYIAPFFWGLVIALVMEPLNRLLSNKMRIKRWVSSMICLALFIAIFASLGVWLISTLARQARAFSEAAPQHIEEITARLDEANIWIDRFSERLPYGLYVPPVEEIVPAAVTFLFGDTARVSGLRTIGSIGDYFLILILGLVSAYFFMADSTKILAFFKNVCPEWLFRQISQTKIGLVRALVGYFRAQGILMLIVGAICIAALFIMGSPYALLLGILFSFLDFLPAIGPGLILVPWIIVSLLMGNVTQAVWLLVLYVAIILVRHILQPKILGVQMGAHPLAVLVAIYIGFRVFGILGIIIGPTILMIYVVLRESGEENCMTQQSAKSA
ncbi:MAG: sporulation integral membrane protein YtvI [Defluviitaleaceae bacterium]|nr:sporulation integral membrane protein YtvI [Defluviitaleaceae bacterium]